MRAVYFASRWSRRKECLAYAARLQDLGVEITSSWIFRGGDENVDDLYSAAATRVAERDFADVMRADTVILLREEPRTPTRGGRLVEAGIALGKGKTVILLGPRSTVFDSLPQITRYSTFAELDRRLTMERALAA